MYRMMISAALAFVLAACATPKGSTATLIRECPEEKIVNRMPVVRDDHSTEAPARSYFIYKGQRREIAEFDTAWLQEHCQVRETVVH